MKLDAIRVLGVATAFLFASAACNADESAGLHDGGDGGGPGGAGTPGTPGTAGIPGTAGTPGTDGTPGAVVAYGLSADPSLDLVAVATGSAAGPVTVLNGNDGAPLHVLKPTTQKTTSPIVRQASGLVAVADLDVVWVFRSDGTLLRGIPQSAAINGMALSADGTVVMITRNGDGAPRRFQVTTGAELPRFAPNPDAQYGASIEISPDGAHVVATGGGRVSLWRVADGALLMQLPGPAYNVALSATGELAVVGDIAVSFYSLTGASQGWFPAVGYARLAYSSDGSKVAISTSLAGNYQGEPTVVRIVDRPTGAELATLYDGNQGRPASGESGASVTGMAFLEHDTAVAVGWSNGRVTSFGASDGVAIWSRVLGE